MEKEKKVEKVKIVFVGGHHTPALAVVDALAPKFKVFWIGHKYSMWGDKNVSAEHQEVTRRGIPFYDLKAGKLYKTFHPLKLLRLPFGFLQAFFSLLKIKPDLIVSFGGYLAPPVVIAGWLLRIPSVTHEQTVEGGWANRLVARFAKKVFVSWEESLKHFPREKAVLTGNPLREVIVTLCHSEERSDEESLNLFEKQPSHLREILPLRTERSERAQGQDDRPTIYITGGKQGSHAINVVAKIALPRLLEKYNVIHQCGRSTVYNDYEDLTSLISNLPPQLRSRYVLKDYFTEDDIGAVLNTSQVIISRAGANIVYELAALGKPAILIPIPWVSHDEQRKNAQILVNAGSAIILDEVNLTPESLAVYTAKLFSDLEKFREGGKRARKLVRLNAAEKMAGEVVGIISPNPKGS